MGRWGEGFFFFFFFFFLIFLSRGGETFGRWLLERRLRLARVAATGKRLEGSSGVTSPGL